MSDTGTLFTINSDGEISEDQLDNLIIAISYDNMHKKVEQLEKENARLREALSFYAETNNWFLSDPCCGYHVDKIYDDCGEHYIGGRRAREALGVK